MSWGATGFTPIVTNNNPPFGFHEVITPPDFKTNPADPWISTDQLKADLSTRFAQLNKEQQQQRQHQLAGLIEPFQSRRRSTKHILFIVLLIIIGLVIFT